MTAPRLLVITYDFGPDGPVGGLRWAGITKHLARMGWQVVVVTADPAAGNRAAVAVHVEPCPRLWTLLDACRLLRSRYERWRGSVRPSSPVTRSARPGLLHRVRAEVVEFLAFPDVGRGWVFRAALRARSLIRQFQPHVVVSSGPPHSGHLVAAMATIGSPARWLIDLRDPWAGSLPVSTEPHPRLRAWIYYALLPRLERLTLRAVHGVITNTPQLAAVLAARYPDLDTTCIPNGVDAECLPSLAGDAYPGLAIAYAGTMYLGRDLGPVVQAMRLFFERHPEAPHAGSKLRVAGEAEGPHARAFASAVRTAGLEPYVEVLGRLPRTQALQVVSRSRLAVVLAQGQELQIPAKLYESVAMGDPTLVVAEADSAAGLEGRRLRAVVRDPGDIEGIACVLEQLWRDECRQRVQCPVPITYEAIAPLVDELLKRSVGEVRLGATAAQRGDGRSYGMEIR